MGNDDRYLLVTSDAHGGAPTGEYKAYLPASMHDEFDAWLASIVNPWVDTTDRFNADDAVRIAAMDADGVAGEIVFPNTLPPFFDILAHLTGVPRDRASCERKWAGLQAHNRWLEDFCRLAPVRRRGIVQLLPNDIDAAVREVEWAASTGVMAGVMLPGVPPNHDVDPYFHERYAPLWDACVAAGLPVHQHQGTGAPDARDDADVSNSIFFTELDFWTRRTLHHLIVGGVFERHPELQFVWTEMWGLRWAVEDLAHITRRLRNVQTQHADDPLELNYSAVFTSNIVNELSLTPIEYFQRNCSIGASMLPRHDVKYINALGVDRILWGTDAPHPEGSAPYTTAALQATLWDFPEADLRAILGETAARLYGFDLDALAPIAAAIGPRVADVARPLEQRPVWPGAAFATEDPLEALLA